MDDMETAPARREDAGRVALAYASLMLAAALQAVRADMRERQTDELAELDRRLQSGASDIALHIRRNQGQIAVSVALLAPGLEDPFTSRLLRIDGPEVKNLEEFARLAIMGKGALH